MGDHPTSVASRWGDLGLRAVSGAVLIAIAILSAREEPGRFFVLFWLTASIGVLWEWERLVDGGTPILRVCIGATALIVIAVSAFPKHSAFAGQTHVNLGLFCVCIVCASAMIGLSAQPGRRVWAATGMLYAGILLLSVLALRFSYPNGVRAIIWLFAVVWSTDVFAYFGGRLIGGPKLWPRISPSKTWSGTLIGVTAGGVVGTFAALRDLQYADSVYEVLSLSLAAAALSQAGDAFESGMKRHFGVKDSSALIPGHGGVMDRLDGFIAAAVFAVAIGSLRQTPSIAGALFHWH